MTAPIKTYDCEGCHSFCYGGYHMEEVADGYGDWVRKEDHDAAMNVAHARIAALEAQIAPVAPAVDAQPVESEGVRHFNYLCSLLPEGFHWSDPLTPDVMNHIVSGASAQSEGLMKDAWISVDDRLPTIDYSKPMCDRGVTVLAAWGDGQVAEMKYKSNAFAKTEKGRAPRFEWQGRVSPWTVTHWMPLPEAPAAMSQRTGEKDD